MYGEWQLGHVTFSEYRERHIRFSEAMRTVSSNIKLVGVGALHLPTDKDTSSINLDGTVSLIVSLIVCLVFTYHVIVYIWDKQGRTMVSIVVGQVE